MDIDSLVMFHCVKHIESDHTFIMYHFYLPWILSIKLMVGRGQMHFFRYKKRLAVSLLRQTYRGMHLLSAILAGRYAMSNASK